MADQATETLEVTSGGKTYRLGRIQYGIKAQAEQEIKKAGRAEFRDLIASLTETDELTVQRATEWGIKNLIKPIVTRSDLIAFFSTGDGELLTVAHSLQSATVGMTADDAKLAAVAMLDGLPDAERERVSMFLAPMLAGI